MTDASRARALLAAGGLTLALCRGEETLTSDRPGLGFLFELVCARDLTDFAAADTVVGKAAALLYVGAGVRSVHGRLMSAAAADVLASHRVDSSSDGQVALIMNRDHSGPCPLEQAAAGLDDPADALAALRAAIAALRARADG